MPPTHTKLDGTLVAKNPEFGGSDAPAATSFRIDSLHHDGIRSQGTEIYQFSLVDGIEAGREFTATSTNALIRSDDHRIHENREYWINALAFLTRGVEDSIGIQDEFDRLAAELKSETAHLSSATMIAGHRAFQEIVGMGQEAIPLILRDLKEAPTQWFLALRSIARESPIRPEDRGNVEKMAAAWLDWGERRRYV